MEKKVRGGVDLTQRLPEPLLLDILLRLDIESQCSAAPVCRSLRSFVSETLASNQTLDLSGFSPNHQILNRVLGGNIMLQRLALDCTRLDDSSIDVFAKGNLQELVLFKCSMSSCIFTKIGEKCPNLRVLTLETLYPDAAYNKALVQMLTQCLYLESLSIKIKDIYFTDQDDDEAVLILTRPIRSLLLQPISKWQAESLIRRLSPMVSGLKSLTLVLDIITDGLLSLIADNLCHLADLCLEDKPFREPLLPGDLTNNGFHSLGLCRNLTRLSLTRNRQFRFCSFRRVNDVGMLLLAERCKGLESVRFCGFSKVRDAGYASFLHSCKNLKRYEIVDGSHLSDLTFHGIVGALSSLVEVRLVSCNLLTSEAVVSLSSCRGLEVIDLSGCKSIGDTALYSIAMLCRLTMLDLGGADISDMGLAALGSSSSPIASLCLQGCERITDEGVDMLLCGSGVISRTLSTLDLGFLPVVSDRSIITVAGVCRKISNLCIRQCCLLTDASVEALSSMEGSGVRSLRRLDLSCCPRLSIDSLRSLDLPCFPGLRWLGVGRTRWAAKGRERLVELSAQRPGLSICFYGCAMGCKDGWQCHEN